MTRLTALIVCLALMLSICGPIGADRGAGSLRLTANPVVVPADGKSICTISAEVRDRDGSMVPDGTEVRFSASLGVIEEIAQTSASVARVQLTSSDIAGECIVTATWMEGQAVAQTTVSFGGRGEDAAEPQYVDINAEDYLAFSIDYRVLEAIGNVKIRYRSMVMTADEVQVDLQLNRIIARSSGRETPIEIRTRDRTLKGDFLICDIAGLQGQLISISSGDSQTVDLRNGESRPSDGSWSFLPEEFEFTDLSETSILVKGTDATVFPSEKIQFKSAGIYVNGKRTFWLPYYVLSLTDSQADESQYVGYSTGGLTLNLPLYYSLTPSSSGALLIRHGQSSGWGWYGQKPGWFLDVRQKYNTPSANGELLFTQVTGSDWGAHLSHSQRIDSRTQGYLYVDWAAHTDLFGMANLSRTFNGFNASLNFYGSHIEEGGDYGTTEFTLQTHSKPLGKLPARYSLTSRTTHVGGSDLGNSVGMQQSLLGNMYSDPFKLGKDVSLRTSLGLGYRWGNERSSGMSTVAAAVLEWRMSSYSRLQLNYRFADRATSYTNSTYGKQNLSAHLRLSDGKRWGATMLLMKGLDYSSTNILTDLSYYLDSNWRIGMRSTWNQYGDLEYNDVEYALGRRLGSRELMAVWSRSQNKIMLELGSGGF